MRYADDSCRSALLQRLLPLREREPYSAALDMRFASETQPDRNPLLPYVRLRAANLDRRPSARGLLSHGQRRPAIGGHITGADRPIGTVDPLRSYANRSYRAVPSGSAVARCNATARVVAQRSEFARICGRFPAAYRNVSSSRIEGRAMLKARYLPGSYTRLFRRA